MRGSKVVVVPWSLDEGRAFGIEGEGPGEMRVPQGLAAIADTLVVFDRSNARLSWYGPNREFLYSRQLMVQSIKPTFWPMPGGQVLVPSPSETHYAVIDSAGVQAPVIPRPDGARPGSEMPITSNLLVSTRAGPAIVDVENGIVGFQSGAEDPRFTSIPPDIRAAIERRLDSLRAQDPAGERSVTPIVSAGEAPGGVVVWFVGEGDPAGAVVDMDGGWQAIRVSPDMESLPANPLDVLLREQEIFLLTSEGLRVYRVNR
jgi:hypothetical protein